jgi:single-stranded-DNA-specific exonuclease
MVETQREWQIVEHPERVEIERLQKEVENLHPLISALLLQRGLRSFDQLKGFFNPTVEQIEAYGEMKDQLKAAERLNRAIENGESILLYGDYDVDGTCSVSMMKLFLDQLGSNAGYYIPDRYSEGYGVSQNGVAHALENGIDLFITLDCGISATEKLNELSAKGVDVIICDHHLPGSSLPDVYAIMNPQQEDCNFDGRELCGAGVALMLMRSVSALRNEPKLWTDYFYLAAIATCSDIVPLTGINRSIVSAGIRQINDNCPHTIRTLLDVSAYKSKLNVSDVVFKIGPRLNAAGRLKHAHLAVHLMTARNGEDALELAREVDSLNRQRRDLDKSTTIEARQQVEEDDPQNENYTNIAWGESWNKGVIGIVASRLIEYRYKPTIVFAQQEDKLTGSARSIEGLNMYEILNDCSDHIEKFGGHAMAAGLTIQKKRLDDFKESFERAVRKRISQADLVPKIRVDLEIDFSTWYNDEYWSFKNQMHRLRPFGPDHMSPVFGTRNCLVKDCQIVGSDHLKLRVYQPHDPQRIIPAIAFGMADYYDVLANRSQFDLAYTIGENEWNGKTSIQLEVKDIHLV